MENATLVAADLLVERDLETKFGTWTEHLFRYADHDIVVLSFGAWRDQENVLVRTHSACLGGHYFWSVECDCREQLEAAFERIVADGAGLIVLLDQEGRGNGHAAVMRVAPYARAYGCSHSVAYRALGYPEDGRSYLGAAVVLRKLGVTSVRLMTDNPAKISTLASHGLSVVSAE
ncbi:MAG TPA: GTP cyclohydrolase [Thermoanaerobaculia bacterium]|jgi:GTP cyclohydrolase II|nr:GTP cyclohydrolase [Thermoanaerobaculia bacterium]